MEKGAREEKGRISLLLTLDFRLSSEIATNAAADLLNERCSPV